MKNLSIKYLFAILSSMLIMTACQKDKIKNEIFEDDDRMIRVLKVEYVSGAPVEYVYNESGKLTEIYKLDDQNKHWSRANVSFNEESIFIEGGTSDYYWNNTRIFPKEKDRVEIIMVETPRLTYPYSIYSGKLIVSRTDANKISKIEMEEPSTYLPLMPQITEYNSFGLPQSLVVQPNLKVQDLFYINMKFESEFEYDRGENIPSVLKRLVNEELLFLNRYGVVNFDAYFINEAEGRVWSELGEGNWLVSFGLPQYHILEDKSSHIVSKRMMKHYKINDAGEREYLKTTVEDFPYVHDASAKTLEIAGLKIWYEFIE